LLDLIIAANIFAQMAVFVQMSTRKSTEFQLQVDMAYTAMNNLKIPLRLQEKVINNLIQTYATLDQQQELSKFLSMISPSLKHKVGVSIFSKILIKNRRFNDTFDIRVKE
jgi:hypothetical protein